jgi:hypothetical protein
VNHPGRALHEFEQSAYVTAFVVEAATQAGEHV